MAVNYNIHLLQAPSLSSASMTTILFLLMIMITPVAQLSFDYSTFNATVVNLTAEGDAFINAQSYIQLTVAEQGKNSNQSVGRVTNSKLMRLWDKSSGSLSDFTTEFSFNIFAQGELYADGMAFFLAQPNLPFLRNLTFGDGLGIFLPPSNNKDPIYNSSEYIFVAVEFDTFHNPGVDPIGDVGTHVGININSVISNTSEIWYADILDPNKDYSAKIAYNSTAHILRVTFRGYSNDSPIKQHLSHQLDLRHYLPEWVMVGFSAATGELFELHTLKSWSLHSSLQIEDNAASPTPTIVDSPVAVPIPGNPPPPEKRSKIGLWVGLGTGLSFFICFIGSAWFLKWKRSASTNEEHFVSDLTMDDEFERGTGPKKFSYNELMRATNNFAEEEKLGQGGFGVVYRGFIRDLDSYVAIKRVSSGSQQGIKEYATEVKVISQLTHKNLVQLIGWCHQKSDLLLIYEFMPNCSLDVHLFEEHHFLTWQVRYNIAQGIASALLYLQELWEQCVLHRDIKSSNIMLDSNFNAKLGDFGLARLVDHGKGSQTTVVAGTMGYMAPECVITGKASKQSDIYSIGVVALEIACGRKPINLRAKEGQVRMVEWVLELYGVGKLLDAADPKLRGEFDIQQMECLMVVGLWCAHPDYMLRPSIRQAIHVLNFEAPMPVLPQKMPVATYLPPPSTASMPSVSLSIGANGFEIEHSGTQSSKTSGYTSSSQFTSSSAGSASAALKHTH